MLYKTITLGLLQQHTRRIPMPLLDRYSGQLASCHADWTTALTTKRPQSDPRQLADEALELAVKELQGQLEIDFPTADGPLSLDQAMAFVRKHTPPKT